MHTTYRRVGVIALLGVALALGGCASKPPPEKVKVGVLLPGDDAGPRWDQADRPTLENQFKGQDYAFDPDISTASTPDEATTATTKMIDGGSKVLVFAAANRQVEVAITTTARARGVPTVGYDLTDSPTSTTGASGVSAASSADFVVTTDYRQVGGLMGRALVRGVRDKPDATVIELDSGPTPAAAQIAEGQRDILGPRYDKHLYRLLAAEPVNPADPRAVTATLTRLIDTHGRGVDAVLTANDAVAQAAITALRQRGLAGKTTVTGFGARPEALKAMLRGEQFATGYIPPAAQATSAATIAKALALGDRARLDQLAPPDPTGRLRRVLVAPTAITLTNINQVFNSGVVDSADICDNTLALRCNQLSIP